MTIKKVTNVGLLEIYENGEVGVRLNLLLVDGAMVLSTQHHRTMIPAWLDGLLQLGAVNDHLSLMGWPALNTAQMKRILAFQVLARSGLDPSLLVPPQSLQAEAETPEAPAQ